MTINVKTLPEIPCVYRIDFNNNSYYYGRTKNLRSRMLAHMNDCKNMRHSNCYFQSVYHKHGICHVQIIEPSNSIELEQKYIDTYIDEQLNVNLSPSATGGKKGQPVVILSASDGSLIEIVDSVSEGKEKYSNIHFTMLHTDKKQQSNGYIVLYQKDYDVNKDYRCLCEFYQSRWTCVLDIITNEVVLISSTAVSLNAIFQSSTYRTAKDRWKLCNKIHLVLDVDQYEPQIDYFDQYLSHVAKNNGTLSAEQMGIYKSRIQKRPKEFQDRWLK